MPNWVLAVDFGTSFTVAASKFAERAPEVIEIAGERRMPSVILIDGEQVMVGRLAEELSATNPKATIRALKNRLGDQAPVVLDGRPYAAVSLVSELLRHVYRDVLTQMPEPPSAVHLTHPATWNRPRLNRLLEAADLAGLPSPVLVPEPVAAALSFAAEVGIAPGSFVAVYDLGGGTFDSAVVTSGGGGFTIVGRPGGDQHIGGELFDEIVVNHIGEHLEVASWAAVQSDLNAPWPQVASTLRNESRRAKETLSANHYADVIVPLPSGLVQLRVQRADYEALIRPFIDETVVLLERCVSEAGIHPDRLAGISLAGGASRTPLVEDAVTAAFPSVSLIRRADPKTAVALGATLFDPSGAPSLPPRWGSQPSAPPPPPQPSSSSSLPAVSALPSAQPVSLPPPAPAVPGSGASPPFAPGPVPGLVAGASVPSGSARSGSRTRWVVATVVVVALAVGGWLVVGGSNDPAPAPLPTRAEVSDALVPIREVRLVAGAEWEVVDVGDNAQELCEQFGGPEPEFRREVAFAVAEPNAGRDGGAANVGVSERITVYSNEADAIEAFADEVAVADECKSEEFDADGVSYTYTLSNAEAETRDVGRRANREIVSVRYDIARTDDKGAVMVSGFIVEERVGQSIIAIDGSIGNRDVIEEDVVVFLELADTIFSYAEARLTP